MQTVSELTKLITLEQIEENIFRGESYETPWGRVFGGQVLAQSLHAATRTVPAERIAHSIHAYFTLPGDISKPIVYEVDRIRDGGSFTTRRVVAIQNGRPIFNMSASFQVIQEGFDHQVSMPDVPMPEELKTDQELLAEMDAVPKMLRGALIPRPIEFRPVERYEQLVNTKHRHVWLKAKSGMEDNLSLHQQVLAYSSDYNLLSTALLAHSDKVANAQLQLASIDHAMWFHRPFRIDDWLLFSIDSPSASNSRGFSRGSFFNKDGILIASVVQEGLMRIKQETRA